MRDGGQASGGSRHVSRLECIKEAVVRHLDHLSVERPNCQVRNVHLLTSYTSITVVCFVQVALVLFESKVAVCGDGTTDGATVEGATLSNYDQLLEKGRSLKHLLSDKPLVESIE